MVSGAAIDPDVLAWAGRVRPGTQVASCTVWPLAGGGVAGRVEQMTLHLTGNGDPLELVRKDVPEHEIAGLRAAQAVRPDATAVPELVAAGPGWLITPFAPGSPLAWGDAVPGNVLDSLARLHAHYHGGTAWPAEIPRVTPAWWQALCRDWVDPQLCDYAARHPEKTTTRARVLISRAAGLPAVSAVLAELTPTLLHGDVHHGNVVRDGEQGTLIDECRERAVEAIEVHIAGLQADGELVPDEIGTPQLLAVTVAA
jgi:Phosphotransferase enzyme family